MDRQNLLKHVNEDVAGELGLAVQLEEMVPDEGGHMKATKRILQDWPM